MAKLIQVIETSETKGDGSPENPTRVVLRLWNTEGVLLAENDIQIEREASWYRDIDSRVPGDRALQVGYRLTQMTKKQIDAAFTDRAQGLT